MQIVQITPNIGAVVIGIDLSKPLDGKIIKELRSLFVEHMVLVFRNQQLTRDQHKSFSTRYTK